MKNFNIYEFVTPSDPITFLADDDEDRNISSMSQWVKGAWQYAAELKFNCL